MTRRPVVTTRRADEDVHSAIAYLSNHGGRSASTSFIDALEAAFGAILDHPSIGSVRFAIESRIPDVRTLALRGHPYLLVYARETDAIVVIRVLHRRRDLPALFASGGDDARPEGFEPPTF